MADDVLKAELEINDLADVLQALTSWEREFEDERHAIRMFLDLEFDDFPIPEEHQESFREVLEGIQKKARRRSSVLSDLAPRRAEQAALLKAKVIMIKRRMVGKLTDQLCAPEPKPTEVANDISS